MREIPAVHRFTTDPAIAVYGPLLGRAAVRAHVQAVLDEVRESGRRMPAAPHDAESPGPSFDELRRRMLARLAAAQFEGLVAVINGTGVLLHTNFGRAPLSAGALAAVAELGAGYTNLEYDLERGERGSRHERVASLLRELSGAEAALVVNNCAAAVLLVLDTFARGRDVVVSRGQLIEIGGGFRLPDVLAKSGAKLVEVGTTNKTYARDYRDAWTADTAMFMLTHPSNFRLSGFTADVPSATLASLAHELGAIAFEDLGSGALVDLAPFGLPHEPTLADEIAAGIDLVAISGDKLLGGPQCGIIAGRADLVATLTRNPLLRALRPDKMTISALASSLSAYADGRTADIPLLSMLALSEATLLERAARLCAAVRSRAPAIEINPIRCTATTGGGTLPDVEIPSAGVAVERADDAYAARLRRGRPPVIGRVENERFVVDLRTVREAELDALAHALAAAHDDPSSARVLR